MRAAFGTLYAFAIVVIPAAGEPMKLSRRTVSFAAAFALMALSGAASAQTKWDLPAAYPASNFHTENLVQFANDVDKASGGKLKITVHANASLFKANEIKRAVQGGQAPIGEVLLVNFENENPIYGADGIPFLAASYADSKKLPRRKSRSSTSCSARRE
jgi:TRAP-type C4-dicarboxylate transport system substrate-binding protein